MSVDFESEELSKGCWTLRVMGELDREALTCFDRALKVLIDTRPKAILVNLSRTSFVSADTVAVLFQYHTELQDLVSEMRIVGANASVRATLDVLETLGLVLLMESEEEAIRSLRSTRVNP